MMDFSTEIIRVLSNTIKNERDEEQNCYRVNGILHCNSCKQPLEVEKLGMLLPVICDCRKAELVKQQEREKAEELLRCKQKCFGTPEMREWNFENDDRQNPSLSDAMKKYCDNFERFRAESKGLLLYGSVGTGKSYYAACIANELLEQGYTVYMTNFARLTNKLQGMWDEKQEYIDNINSNSLLIIDDLGAERRSEYMQELVFNIIDSRYRTGKPMIITTNLTADELKKPQELGYARIYDRILERCLPVRVDGASRRRKELRETYADYRELLGL